MSKVWEALARGVHSLRADGSERLGGVDEVCGGASRAHLHGVN